MTTIALRPAAPADDEFCFQLHKAAMSGYVAAVWGWDHTVQRAYHARAFAPELWKIITVAGQDAGILIVENRPDEVYLARIEIHPDHQDHSIGARLLHQLVGCQNSADPLACVFPL